MMDEVEVGHRWSPITDLTDDDRAAASEDLPALARTWAQVRETLDPQQVDDFTSTPSTPPTTETWDRSSD